MIAPLQAANPTGCRFPRISAPTSTRPTIQNWPVPQVVLMNWMADTTFDYGPRGIPTIPADDGGLDGSCDNTMYWDHSELRGQRRHWTPGRHNFNYTGSDLFTAYLELQEDLNILQMKRSEMWMTIPRCDGRGAGGERGGVRQQGARLRDRISGKSPVPPSPRRRRTPS